MIEYNIVNKNNRNYTLFTQKSVIPEYIIYMQQENKIDHLINMVVDEDQNVLYDIGSLQCIKTYFVNKGANLANIKIFMKQFDNLLKALKEYLISQNAILINEEYIYTNESFTKLHFIIYMGESKNNQDSITKLFKYIIGNYLLCKSFVEIRIREDILKYLKNNKYNYKKIMDIIGSLEDIKITEPVDSQVKVPFDFKKAFISKFKKKTEYNNNTCEISHIDGIFCLTNILDITKKIYINEDGIIISRFMLSKEYDIHNKKIGRNHARIYTEQDNILLFDMGSKNGTFINGEQTTKRIPFKIEKGDIVTFADEEFIVC